MRMTDLPYVDFDLVLEPSEQGYRARVLNTSARAVESGFELPFSPLNMENLLLRAGQRRGQVRRADSPQIQAAKDLGGPLFDAVFGNEVGACFEQQRNAAAQIGAGLLVRLHLAKTPELADVPWEYLYNARLNRFLALSTDTPVVRYLDLPDTIRSLAIKPPLRVLVMIANPSDSPAPLNVEREWTRLGQALDELRHQGLVEIERLERATLADLQQVLRRNAYHIFHFIGHGHFDNRAPDGMLSLEDDEGTTWDVSGQDLGMHLHNHRWLRLAILNACEGGRPSLVDPFAGAAQSLIQAGIPAVIAMQFEISDDAAIALTHEFYKALADSYPVDAALTEARLAIWRQATDAEWATPVLYLRAPDGRIFDVEKGDERLFVLPSPVQKTGEPRRVVDAEAQLAGGQTWLARLARAREQTNQRWRERSEPVRIVGLAGLGTVLLIAIALLVLATRPPTLPPSTPGTTSAPAAGILPASAAASPETRTNSTVVPTATIAGQPTPATETDSAPFSVLDATPVQKSGRHDVRLDSPWALAVDGSGNVYVANTSDQRIHKLSPDGQPLAQLGSQGSGPGHFGLPEGIAVDRQGNIYVADSINANVQKLSPTGQPLAQWGSPGTALGEFASPQGVALDGLGNVYVTDFGNNNVQKLSPTGQPLAEWWTNGTELGQFRAPQGIVVDGLGNIYVADLLNDRVEKLSPTGEPLAQWGGTGAEAGRFDMPYGVAVDGQGNLYVSERGNARVQKLSSTGQPLAEWGSQAQGINKLPAPVGLALDNQGNIYVSNLFFSRIIKLSPTGQVLSVWGG